VDIPTLTTAIEDAITEADDLKTLILAAGILESDAVTQVFETYLESGELVIEEATVVATPTGVAVAGRSSNTIFTDMTLLANFTIEQGTVRVLITGSPEETWNFASSFPSLDESFLVLLTFADATLSLASYDVSDAITTGLSFQGNLQISSELSFLSLLLGDADLVELVGRIDLQDELPLITLFKRLKGISLGFLELPYVQFGISTVASLDPFSDVDATFTFGSEIAFGSTAIPINAALFWQARTALFGANLTGAVNSALDGLSDLVNGVDLASVIPSDLDLADALTLKDLTLSVNLPQKTLEFVEIEAESTNAWVLVEDAIAIEKLRFNFRVDDIMQPRKKPSMKLYGEIGLGS
jgi:hypothetical protein